MNRFFFLSFTGEESRSYLFTELELSRKNNQRILEKIGQYLASDQFDYVLYLFPSRNLMNKYFEIMSERFKEKIKEKVMFFCDEELDLRQNDIADWKGHFKGKEQTLGELFG